MWISVEWVHYVTKNTKDNLISSHGFEPTAFQLRSFRHGHFVIHLFSFNVEDERNTLFRIFRLNCLLWKMWWGGRKCIKREMILSSQSRNPIEKNKKKEERLFCFFSFISFHFCLFVSTRWLKWGSITGEGGRKCRKTTCPNILRDLVGWACIPV